MPTRRRKQMAYAPRWYACAVIMLFAAVAVRANTFTVQTPGGPVDIDIPHAGPNGSLVEPGPTQTPNFRPPTIFAAPLPSGSGARALGLGGAFTAIADDATAASWNPAGLVQLETPEASVVYRVSLNYDKHTSLSDSLSVGEDGYKSDALNYFSFVYPFRFCGRNVAFSLNYQEAYDFTQRFTADMSDTDSTLLTQTSEQTFTDTQVDNVTAGGLDLTITSYITTHMTSALTQLLSSDMLSKLEFEQQGTIDAATPAFAVSFTPRFSAGVALNFYGDALLGGPGIWSRTWAEYEGTSSSAGGITDTWTTSGTYEYDGTWTIEFDGYPPIVQEIPPGTGTIPPFSDTRTRSFDDEFYVKGTYEELNSFDSLSGENVTLGFLWLATESLTLASAVDLPWEADATQTKTITTHVKTYDGADLLLDQTLSKSVQKDVTFEFPLYWALGARWKWSDCCRSALDVSQTLWSDFSYQAAGEPKLNPLDGTPYGQNPIDDCWSVRLGTEYLWILSWTEIPFRGGVYWDQRPAVGTPDNYWGFSLGGGISLGRGPGKTILDWAYVYRRGEDVMGSLISGSDDLETDTEEHEFFLSAIRHF